MQLDNLFLFCLRAELIFRAVIASKKLLHTESVMSSVNNVSKLLRLRSTVSNLEVFSEMINRRNLLPWGTSSNIQSKRSAATSETMSLRVSGSMSKESSSSVDS